MYRDNNDSIGVTTKGTAETAFVLVTFKASVNTRGQTGPEAKEKALPIIEQVKRVILAHAGEDKAGIDLERLKTSFSVGLAPQRYSNGGVVLDTIEYRATYTITFVGKSVQAAPAVHDALTSISGVEAPTPVYNVDDLAKVYATAFADAYAKASLRFGAQCKAIGLDPERFYVQSWSVTDEQPRGKTLTYRENAVAAKPVGLEPGKATLDMTVNFIYTRKPTQIG